jgi:hypothetical protein
MNACANRIKRVGRTGREWKWRRVLVQPHAGMICAGEAYKPVVKTTFAKGASPLLRQYSRTAEFVGMKRSALHRKLKALGVG